MAKHAKLSPSSAKRWMNCAGSVALIGDESSPGNEAAWLGTAAHKIIETMLQKGETNAETYRDYFVHVIEQGDAETKIFPPKTRGAAKPPNGWHVFIVDDDMIYGVQMMVDEVERVRAEIGADNCDLYTERFLDMSWLDPRLGGTADVTLVEHFGRIHLFDYKNGRIVVEVTSNEQMKNYAVGLLHEHPEADGVTVHLVQPNAPHEQGEIREESYTCDEIKLFEITMKEAADATSAPNALLRVGDWCEWCIGKVRCKAFDAAMLEISSAEFSDDPLEVAAKMALSVSNIRSDVEELAHKAKFIPLFDRWCKDILASIEAALLSGVKVPGMKLVRSKPHRKWANPFDVTVKVLRDKWGIPEEMLLEAPCVKTPAQIEKLKTHDRKTLKDIVASLAIKPQGQLVVADENDERPAVDLNAESQNEFGDDGEFDAVRDGTVGFSREEDVEDILS